MVCEKRLASIPFHYSVSHCSKDVTIRIMYIKQIL